MKDIKVEDLDLQKLTIVMFHLPGCSACESVKDPFKNLAEKHKDTDFYTMQLNKESFEEIYNVYEEKTEKIIEDAVDSKNKRILSKSGKPMRRFKSDKDGNLVLQAKMVVPNFFFFHPDSANDEDCMGFLGNVQGANIDKVENILNNIKDLEAQGE